MFQSAPPYNVATFVNRATAQGRLSASASSALPLTDQLLVAILYYLSYVGGQLGIYGNTDGTGVSKWNVLDFGSPSLALAGLAANTLHDIFAFWRDGAIQMEALPWRGQGQAITGVTCASPAVVTAASHGLRSGDKAYVSGVVGMPSTTGEFFINKVDTNSFQLLGCDTTTAVDATYTAGGWFAARPMVIGAAITGVTAATPIVVTSAGHGLVTGQSVTVKNVVYNTVGSANGAWVVTVLTSSTFSLNGSVGASDNAYLLGGWWESNPLPAAPTGFLDGIHVKPGDPTRRYLGLVRTAGAGLTEDSAARRLIGNRYNAVPRSLGLTCADTHTYASATIRAWNNDATNAADFVTPLPQTLPLSLAGSILSGKAASAVNISVGVDRTTGIDGQIVSNAGVNAIIAGAGQNLSVGISYHKVTVVEQSTTDSGTNASFGLSGTVAA